MENNNSSFLESCKCIASMTMTMTCTFRQLSLSLSLTFAGRTITAPTVFRVLVCLFVCVCERERERERESVCVVCFRRKKSERCCLECCYTLFRLYPYTVNVCCLLQPLCLWERGELNLVHTLTHIFLWHTHTHTLTHTHSMQAGV